MKAKEVLKLTNISRRHLSSLIKQGQIRIVVKPNGQYDYNPEDVYKYIGKERSSLHFIFARVSTPKQKADLTRQIETLETFCLAQKFYQVFSDIASGIKERKTFFFLLSARWTS